MSLENRTLEFSILPITHLAWPLLTEMEVGLAYVESCGDRMGWTMHVNMASGMVTSSWGSTRTFACMIPSFVTQRVPSYSLMIKKYSSFMFPAFHEKG
jgi:hypothetical protein